MTYSQDASFRFRPYRDGEFDPQRPVIIGAETSGNYRRGTQDIAYNQNTLWGQIGHPLINDAQGVNITLTAAATNYDVAVYKFPIPWYLNSGTSSGRKYLKVSMVASVSAGTATLKGRVGTLAGTTTAGSTFGAAVSTVTMNIPIDHGSQYDYVILTLRGTSAGAVVSLYGIFGWILPFTSAADLGSGTAAYRADIYHPVDSTAQTAVNMPLNVHLMRSYNQANEVMYRQNVRPVVTYCNQKNYGTLFAASTGTGQISMVMGSSASTRQTSREWLYFPRQGVVGLAVFIDAYVSAWASAADNCTVNVGFSGFPPYRFTVNKANAFSSSTWLVENFGNTISVPNGPGPYFLQIYPESNSNKTVNLMGVSIFEYNRGQ